MDVKERITLLNKYPVKGGKHIICWMQEAQRTEFNHALEYAIKRASITTKPLFVILCIKPNFPQANTRHHYFMLEGLAEIQKNLKKRHIQTVIKTGKFVKIITKIAKKACEIIVDAEYLKFQRKCRLEIAKKISCKLTQIETNLIVPPETAWPKEEYSARTFRWKINKSLNRFLVKPPGD